MKAMLYFFSFLLLLSSCEKEEPEYGIPITSSTVLSVSTSTATIKVNGVINSNVNMEEWGMKYAAEAPYHYKVYHENASITGNSVTFTCTLTGLDDGTTYYMVPYCYYHYNNVIKSEDTIRFTTESIPPYSIIGETGPGGGLIFYTDGQGGGMEMSTVQRYGSWEDVGNVPGTLSDFGSGENNTLLFTNIFNTPSAAQQQCHDLIEGGFDDWFLPSKDELDLIRDNLVQESHFSPVNGAYLSSTQYTSSSGLYWKQDLVSGSQNGQYKTVNANYVAVRSF